MEHEPDPSEEQGNDPAGEDPAPRVPGRLRALPDDRYRDFKPVGEGGMGIVYWAIDADLEREVAFKIIRPAQEAGEGAPSKPTELRTPGADTPAGDTFAMLKRRFLQEAWITSGMAHPGIVPVYELGETAEGIPYYTMRFIKGEATLAAAIESARDGDLEDRLALLEPFLKVCDAVRYAHARGVIHRDLKPENVALGEFGEAVVLDWGLASVPGGDDADADPLSAHIQAFREATDLQTIAGALGTPGYMAPEAALGDAKATDARSDVYSLGAILFEILTGRLPHEFDSFLALAQKLLKEDPPAASDIDPEVPEGLSDLCAACLARDPSARPADATVLATTIRTWQVERERERERQGHLREAGAALEAAASLHGAELLRETDRATAAIARVLERHPEDVRALAYRERIEALRETGARERERAARKRAVVRSAVAALVVLALGAAIAVAVVDDARREEASQRARADAQLLRARALGLANASALARESNPELALLLAREAGRAQLLPEVVTQMHAAVMAQHEYVAFEGHEGTVLSQALSPSGDRLLSGSEDGTVRLWDLEGRELLVLEHDGPVQGVAWAPDGKTFLAASREKSPGWHDKPGEVRLWSVDGTLLQRIDGHTSAAWRAEFSPSGDRILTLGYDHAARLWSLEGRLLAAFEGHEHPRVTAAWSPSGDRIVTGSTSSIRDSASVPSEVRLWSADGTLLKSLATHGGGVRSVRWSPDGERILSCSLDCTARLFDGEGRQIALLDAYEHNLFEGRFSPSGTHFVAGDWEHLIVWDRDGRRIGTLRGHGSAQWLRIAFSPDGQQVVTATVDRTVRTWDLNGNPRAVLRQVDGRAYEVCFTPAGDRVIATAGNVLRSYSLAAREAAVLATEAWFISGAWSPDGSKVLLTSVTPDQEFRIEVWTASGERLLLLDSSEQANLYRVAWSPGGDRFAVAVGTGVHVYDLEGQRVATLPGTGRVWQVEFLPGGDRILAGAQSGDAKEPQALLFDLAGRRLPLGPAEVGVVRVAAFSPDGTRLLVAGRDDRSAYLCEADGSGAVRLALEGACEAAMFTPDGAQVITVESAEAAGPASHARVRVWDTAGRAVSDWDTQGGRVQKLSPTGDLLLGSPAGGEGFVLWDLQGNERTRVAWRGSTLFQAAFSPAGDRIATGDSDGMARLWDLDGNEQAAMDHTGPMILDIAFDPTGERLLTCDGDRFARIWLTEPDALLRLVESRVTRELTDVERSRYGELLASPGAGR